MDHTKIRKGARLPCGAVSLLTMAGMLLPNPATAREVAYEGDGYTVYLESPQYCSMYLDTSRGSMFRFSYRRTTGEVFFSFVRDGFPVIPPDRSVPILFQFDETAHFQVISAEGYSVDNRNGFSLGTAPDFLERWSSHASVNVRLGDRARTLIEAVSLRGSAQAINQFTACTLPNYSVTMMPPSPEEMGFTSSPRPAPSPQTALGALSIRCGRSGASTYYIGSQMIGRGLDCDEAGKPELSATTKFRTGEQILLVTKPVSMTVAAGSIIFVKPGVKPRLINIDYMTEFGGVPAPNKVRVGSGGQLEITAPRAHWMCELTINWSSATVTSKREIGTRTGMCNSMP